MLSRSKDVLSVRNYSNLPEFIGLKIAEVMEILA